MRRICPGTSRARGAALAVALLAVLPSPARAEPVDERRGLLTLRATYATGVPDFISGGLTVNAIPSVDLELGLTYVAPVFASFYLRAGPRWTLYDGRDADARGVTLRLSALAGPRVSTEYTLGPTGFVSALGLNAVGALEGSYWLARHFGFSAQVAAGGTAYFPLRRPWYALIGPLTPDLRLSIGLSF